MTKTDSSKKMGWGKMKEFFKNFSRFFDDEEAKFRILTGLKMTLVPFFSFLILAFLITVLLKMDMYFFKANEVFGIDNFSESFYDAILNRLSHSVPYMAGLLIFVNILSIYISDILIRPFRLIGDYCEKMTHGKDASYDPDFFTDLKLLAHFSEYFFNYVDIAKKQGELVPIDVPKKYTKIHQPVFETTFFFQFLLFILISLLAVSASIYAFAIDLNDQIIVLANQILGGNRPEINFFLAEQSAVVDFIILGVLITHVVMYAILAGHLYLKVSGPAFGIFATMRSFLKGNYSARVHLIGFYYLRPQCRKLNKYLDHIEKTLVKKEK